MATIETGIDVTALTASGKRGHELVKWAYEALRYDGTPHVNNIYAASMLGYSAATLRNWSSQSNGPIQPKRINGRPYWRMCDIRRLLEIYSLLISLIINRAHHDDERYPLSKTG